MNLSRKIIVLLLIFMLSITGTQTSHAEIELSNNYNNGVMNIYDFSTSGSLGSLIESIHATPSEITTLNIRDGIVNSDDIDWIINNLTQLETLYLLDSCQVHHLPEITDSPSNTLTGSLGNIATLKHVTMDNVSTIDTDTFNQSNLESADFQSLITLGERAFYKNLSLSSINMPLVEYIDVDAFYQDGLVSSFDFSNVTFIGEYAFEETGLTSVSLTNNVTLEGNVFDGITALESFTAPLLTRVTYETFKGCTNLSSVTIPSVTIIEYGAFNGTSSLSTINLEQVITIGDRAFENSDTLTSLNLDHLESVGQYAFSKMDNLSSVYAPSITSFDLLPFSDSTNLTNLTLGSTAPATGIFTDNSYPETRYVHVPEGSGNTYDEVDSVDDNLWEGYIINEIGTDPSLSNINITEPIASNSLKDFPSGTADYSLTVENSITDVKMTITPADSDISLYLDDTLITTEEDLNLDLGLNTYQLKSIAEDGSELITTINITRNDPLSLTINSIESGDIQAAFAEYSSYALNSIESLTIKSGTLISSDFDWLAENISYIKELRLINQTSIDSGSDITDNPNQILDYSMNEFEYLEHVEMNSVIEIKSNAFEMVDHLTTAIFNNVLLIGDYSFAENDKLTSITMPYVDTIGSYAFQATGVTSLNLDYLTCLKSYAFAECDDLTSVITPELVTIESYAFEGCTGLTEFDAPNLSRLGQSAFNNAFDSSTDVTLEFEHVYTLNENVFRDAKLNTLKLINLNEIHANALFNAAIDYLYLGDTIPTVTEASAFDEIGLDNTLHVSVNAYPNYFADTQDGDGNDQMWFTFNINEIGEDSSLAALEVKNYNLNPAFSSDVKSYTLNVENSVSSLVVSARTRDEDAINYYMDTPLVNDTTFEKNLSVGSNSISLNVYAEDGSSSEYIINITRAQAPVETKPSEPSSPKTPSEPSRPSTPVASPKDDAKDKIEVVLSSLNDQQEAALIVDIEEVPSVPADVFDSLKASGNVLEIQGDGFKWTFDGSREGSGQMNGAFQPGISFVEADDLDLNFRKEPAIILQTDYHGELPFEATITLDVSDTLDGKTLILYYFNETTGKLEVVGRGKTQNKQVSFTLKHCSTYIIKNGPVMVDDYLTVKYAFGYEDGSFKPDQDINRAEVVSFLDNLLETAGIEDNQTFTDSNMWAENSINNLYSLGLISGYEDQTFRPYESITRAEMATIITLMFDLDSEKKNTFSDTSNHWASDYINAISNNKITVGYPDNTFRPDQAITRVEALVMINKALKRTATTTETYQYNDVKENHWGYNFIINAASN